MKAKRICRYRQIGWAKRYALELQRRWPHTIFEIVQHPTEFGWSIVSWHDDGTKAYVLARGVK